MPYTNANLDGWGHNGVHKKELGSQKRKELRNKMFLIENNTIIRTRPSVNGAVNTVFTMGNGNFTIRNNIFLVANGVQVFATAPYGIGNYDNVRHDHNLYFCTDGSTANPCGKTLGIGELIADPKFTDMSNADYHLSFESPAINAGINLGYKLDLDIKPVPQNNLPDIGAYEM